MNYRKYFSVFTLALMLAVIPVGTATLTALSTSWVSVDSCCDLATDDDIIVVPAGSASWDSFPTVRAYTLRGAGDGVHKTSDSTVITLTQDVAGQAGFYMDVSVGDEEKLSRISGFIIKSDTTNNTTARAITIMGPIYNVSIDSCVFRFGERTGTAWVSNSILASGRVYGVVHHCLFDNSSREVISGTKSPEEWSRTGKLGTRNAFFVEDCKFKKPTFSGHAITAVDGFKYVFRYDTVINSDMDVHGYCYDGLSMYTWEFYNVFDTSDSYNWSFYLLGGTGVLWNNKIKTNKPFAPQLSTNRVYTNCAHGGCCNTYPCIGQIGRGRDQALAPVYEWGNTKNGTDVDFAVRDLGTPCGDSEITHYIVENREFYNDDTLPGYIPYIYPHPLQYLCDSFTTVSALVGKDTSFGGDTFWIVGDGFGEGQGDDGYVMFGDSVADTVLSWEDDSIRVINKSYHKKDSVEVIVKSDWGDVEILDYGLYYDIITPGNSWWKGSTNTSSKLAANYSPPAIPTSLDTLRFTGDSAAAAFVQDTVLSVYRIVADATFDENFKQAGYRITTVAGASFDAATTGDTVSLDSMIVITGGGDLIFENGPAYRRDTSRLYFDIAGTCSLYNNTGADLYVGGITCAKNATDTCFTAGGHLHCYGKFELGDGVFDIGPGIFRYRNRTWGNTFLLGAGHRIIGGIMGVYTTTEDTIEVPAINTAGMDAVSHIGFINYNAAWSQFAGFKFTGNCKFNKSEMINNGGSRISFLFDCDSVESNGTFSLGNNIPFWIDSIYMWSKMYFGSTKFVFKGYVESLYYNNTATTFLDLGSSDLDIHSGWMLGTNTQMTGGTSTARFLGGYKQVVKCNRSDRQYFYDVIMRDTTGSFIDSSSGGFRASGDIDADRTPRFPFGLVCGGDASFDSAGTTPDTLQIVRNVTSTSATASFHTGKMVSQMTGCTLVVAGATCAVDVDGNATIAAISAAAGKVPTFTGAGNLTLAAQSTKDIDTFCIASTGTVTMADSWRVGGLSVSSGTMVITDVAGADTVRRRADITGGTFNTSNDEIVFGGDLVFAAGATHTTDANTVYRFTKNGVVLTSAGRAQPQLQFLNNFRINDGCTIRRLIWSTDGKTGTFEAGETFTLTNLTAANWSGVAGSLNALRSSVNGTHYTITVPAGSTTVNYMNPRDCWIAGGGDLVYSNSVSGGGNR